MNYAHPDKTLVLQRDSFCSWLEARHDLVVGTSSIEVSCPLACWLSDLYRLPCQVSFTAYQVQRDTCTVDQYPLPAWSQPFVYFLDVTYTFTEVTGYQALVLLDELEVVL